MERSAIPELPDETNIKPVLASLPVRYFPVIRADVPNKNGRVFSKECLQRACDEMQERIDRRLMFVHEPHREREALTLESVIGVVKAAHFDGEYLNVEVQFTNPAWDMITRCVSMNYSAEGTVDAHGMVVDMNVNAIMACPTPAAHLF